MPESASLAGWTRTDPSWLVIAKYKGQGNRLRLLLSLGPFKSQEEALARVEQRALTDKAFRKLYAGWLFMAADASIVLELTHLGAVVRHKDEVVEVAAR